MITSFKIFEEYTLIQPDDSGLEYKNNDYTLLATNESFYSWEYDHRRSLAEILLDKNDNSLYLKITNVHKKTGLGAGTFKNSGEFVKIGNLKKANLALVRTLLKKHQYDQRKFSRFWEDDEGNKMSLTDIIKLYKIEQPENLKHIKSTEQTNDIELIKYSDKAYALLGEDTKRIKDDLKSMGCRFNKFLKDPKTGETRAGWIFPNYKLEKIKELL